MQKVTLTRPIELKVGAKKRVLGPGEQVLTDQEMALWFIPGLVASGVIVLTPSAPAQPTKLNYSNTKIILGEGGSHTVVPDEIKPVAKLNKRGK